ncbi:hypothetical protein Srot_1409 [Segniliparus rotundus DSM 44985]|uniref:Low molecular weight antigen MTB12-like C-terminal domain-containing protein n=1 Tax=Segniliparus rotundus (strain ATCC BAA-972 / CDC 1076 / CIP 108378 / DSM 44985 / JCM 13578) TaxID=640132 RepID=D6Z7E3_SEGRD|nr:hypothetical protein Srot_1409 [Segniliparus rotundus DSM 44985]
MALTIAPAAAACHAADPPIRESGPPAVLCARPIPSVDTLQSMLDKARDPKIPSKDKTDLIEDGDKDPELFDQLVEAYRENPDIGYKILDESKIDSSCLLHVFFSISKGEQRLDKVEIFFVWQNDKWKLAKRSVCSLLVDILQRSSPLCGSYVPSGPFPSLTIPSDIHLPK